MCNLVIFVCVSLLVCMVLVVEVHMEEKTRQYVEDNDYSIPQELLAMLSPLLLEVGIWKTMLPVGNHFQLPVVFYISPGTFAISIV
jgi:uncharacterized membrane protein YiaA